MEISFSSSFKNHLESELEGRLPKVIFGPQLKYSLTTPLTAV